MTRGRPGALASYNHKTNAMKISKSSLAAFSILLAVAVPAASAGSASSTTSSASDSASTSVGASSDSFGKSSDGSSRKTGVAAGDYRVVQVADVSDRPGTVQLTLRPVEARDASSDAALFLPAAILERNGLAAGRTITARERPYGVEFSHADSRESFYLVLRDDWYRELQTIPVQL